MDVMELDVFVLHISFHNYCAVIVWISLSLLHVMTSSHQGVKEIGNRNVYNSLIFAYLCLLAIDPSFRNIISSPFSITWHIFRCGFSSYNPYTEIMLIQCMHPWTTSVITQTLKMSQYLDFGRVGPFLYESLNTLFSNFPLGVFGISSTNTTPPSSHLYGVVLSGREDRHSFSQLVNVASMPVRLKLTFIMHRMVFHTKIASCMEYSETF